jgi:hypothetical protein
VGHAGRLDGSHLLQADILAARGLPRQVQSLVYTAGDKGERVAAEHPKRRTLVVSEDEHWQVERRILTPPALP